MNECDDIVIVEVSAMTSSKIPKIQEASCDSSKVHVHDTLTSGHVLLVGYSRSSYLLTAG